MGLAHLIEIMKEEKDYSRFDAEYIYEPNFDETQSYALGLLWADGYMTKSTCRARNVAIEVVEADFYDFLPALESLGKVCVSKRTRENRKPQAKAHISNKALCEWLFNAGFKDKSLVSPVGILNFISKDFVKDFIRGWIDGDGCFYVNEKNKQYQFSISGTYYQDWTSLTRIFDKLNITYKYWQQKQTQNGKENSYSYIRIINRPCLIKLIDFIYDNPKHFLKRKFDKCQLIKNASYGNNSTQNIKQFDLNGDFIKAWKDTQEIVKFYNLRSSSPIMAAISGKNKTSLGYKWSL